MQTLQILLFNLLGRNEAHARSSHRFTDRLRIVGIILLSLYVGLHKLRRDQAHRVPQSAQYARNQ